MAKKRGATQAQSGVTQVTLDAKLLAYCAMASGALLAAPPAEAFVVYSGVKNIRFIYPSSGVRLDLDSNAATDMIFHTAGYGLIGFGIGLININSNSIAVHNNLVSHLAYGTTIGAYQSWKHEGFLNGYSCKSRTTYGVCGAGSFPLGFFWNEGYIGVKFFIGSEKHFGWVRYYGRMAVGDVGGGIVDWAYESTPDTPIKAGQTATDTDGDGIPDASDNCPAVANPQQLDADNDTIGDVCDPAPGCGGCGQAACEYVDTDNDGIQNYVDNCPAIANPLQKDADSDGIGDACDSTPGCGGGCGQPVCEGEVDTDHDYVRDAIDTCPSVFNPNQLDANGNGLGDCCDPSPGCGGEGQPTCDTFCSL